MFFQIFWLGLFFPSVWAQMNYPASLNRELVPEYEPVDYRAEWYNRDGGEVDVPPRILVNSGESDKISTLKLVSDSFSQYSTYRIVADEANASIKVVLGDFTEVVAPEQGDHMVHFDFIVEGGRDESDNTMEITIAGDTGRVNFSRPILERLIHRETWSVSQT